MTKKSTLLQMMILSSSLVFMLSACSPQKNEQKVDNCSPETTPCLQLIFTESTITFDHSFVKSEQVYLLRIKSKNNLKKAWIEPVNMQMGHIPLPIEKSDLNHYTATLLIGLCSEPIMEWIVYLEYENGVIDQQAFASYWSDKYRNLEK